MMQIRRRSVLLGACLAPFTGFLGLLGLRKPSVLAQPPAKDVFSKSQFYAYLPTTKEWEELDYQAKRRFAFGVACDLIADRPGLKTGIHPGGSPARGQDCYWSMPDANNDVFPRIDAILKVSEELARFVHAECHAILACGPLHRLDFTHSTIHNDLLGSKGTCDWVLEQAIFAQDREVSSTEQYDRLVEASAADYVIPFRVLTKETFYLAGQVSFRYWRQAETVGEGGAFWPEIPSHRESVKQYLAYLARRHPEVERNAKFLAVTLDRWVHDDARRDLT